MDHVVKFQLMSLKGYKFRDAEYRHARNNFFDDLHTISDQELYQEYGFVRQVLRSRWENDMLRDQPGIPIKSLFHSSLGVSIVINRDVSKLVGVSYGKESDLIKTIGILEDLTGFEIDYRVLKPNI